MEFEPGNLLQLGLCILTGVGVAAHLVKRGRQEVRLELSEANKQKLLSALMAPPPADVVHCYPVRLELCDETIVPCCGANLEDLPDDAKFTPPGKEYTATCKGRQSSSVEAA